jgi:hypothetical protein
MALGHARGSKASITMQMMGLRCCRGAHHDLTGAVLYPDGLASQEARDFMVRAPAAPPTSVFQGGRDWMLWFFLTAWLPYETAAGVTVAGEP